MKIEFKDYKIAVDFAYNLTRDKYMALYLYYDYDKKLFYISEETNVTPYRIIGLSSYLYAKKENYLKAAEYGIKYVDAMEELEMEGK